VFFSKCWISVAVHHEGLVIAREVLGRKTESEKKNLLRISISNKESKTIKKTSNFDVHIYINVMLWCWHQVFLIGKDFGSITAYLVAVVHPERVSGLVSLGIPFLLPGPNCIRNDFMPSGFYITRWQVRFIYLQYSILAFQILEWVVGDNDNYNSLLILPVFSK